ncbi:hypothetical protein [Streptomyces sp. NBC_01232]|uniref:hypothetical protein n=1 Tax=Streptomyces sp. NBC_01232 TaxID=2903786 RepID=UPI002E160DA2
MVPAVRWRTSAAESALPMIRRAPGSRAVALGPICDRGRGGAAPTPAGERAVALARRILRMPELSPREAAEALDITDLDPEGPVRQVGYVTTAESASILAAGALIREFRSGKG